MAQRLNRWTIGLAITICTAWLWACGGTPLKVTPVDKTENPTELIRQLASSLQDARGNQVDLLSPTWYKKAKDSYARAKRGLDQQEALSGILKNISNGRAELEQAEVVAMQSRDQLADTITSRADAMAVNAQQYKTDFADAENMFLKLTRAIENKDFKYARDKSKEVTAAYRDLELRSITTDAIGDARSLMQKAAAMKIQKIAPRSYAEAQKALAQAETYIAQNRYGREAIQQKASHAQFMAQRAIAIGQESRSLEDKEPEAVALWVESLLADTASALQAPDRRNQAFKDQQAAILADIAALRAQNATIADKDATIRTLTDRLAEVEGTSQKVKSDKERLAAEKRFNELYIRVQGYFNADEAEVYKQFDRLVIRLKGIQFPSGQAVLQPASYPLMTKVQKAIRTFGKPEVIIEGHTDSIGSTETNNALSDKRANAVKQYLVANGTLPASKITAVGHGSTRPIASNKTQAGRAQNRRIDLIIKPRMQEM